MSYIEDVITKIKTANLEDYDFSSQEIIPDLWNMFLTVRAKVNLHYDFLDSPFIYFERSAGTNRILAFRMPASESCLIYRCISKEVNGRLKQFVSVAELNGRESQKYLEVTARLIIPFFRSIEAHMANEDYPPMKCTIDMRTGKYRQINYSIDELKQRRDRVDVHKKF